MYTKKKKSLLRGKEGLKICVSIGLVFVVFSKTYHLAAFDTLPLPAAQPYSEELDDESSQKIRYNLNDFTKAILKKSDLITLGNVQNYEPPLPNSKPEVIHASLSVKAVKGLKRARTYKSSVQRSHSDSTNIKQLRKSIARLARKGKLEEAQSKLLSAQETLLLDASEIGAIKSSIAEGYLHAGNIQQAYINAREGANLAGLNVPHAGWIAGLASWSLGRYEDAAILFEIPARSSYSSTGMSTAGAFWAARAYHAAGKPDIAREWLARASEHPQTFYGLLAVRALKQSPKLYLSSILNDNYYPMSKWHPRTGYKIDPSLIHAIVHRESRFNPSAKSVRGATGLMQLMPQTARSISNRIGITLSEDMNELNDPSLNLELGQAYLQHLMKIPEINNNILDTLIAYNAGPGNLIKWKKQWSDVKDPLLFIEIIPLSETRNYVEHVLSSYWIYRMRHFKDTPTLEALIKGKPAQYQHAMMTKNSNTIKIASSK